MPRHAASCFWDINGVTHSGPKAINSHTSRFSPLTRYNQHEKLISTAGDPPSPPLLSLAFVFSCLQTEARRRK